MRATGADVVKIAARSRSAADVVRLLRLGRSARDEAAVLVGMGPIGVPTRLLPGRFGSAWTYAGDGVAPGQVPLSDMIGRYRCHRVSASTAVYGVAGAPIAHSLSPVMHNAGFAEAGLDAIYVPFEATDADDLMALAQALDVKGLSVTAPFKESNPEPRRRRRPRGPADRRRQHVACRRRRVAGAEHRRGRPARAARGAGRRRRAPLLRARGRGRGAGGGGGPWPARAAR